MNRKALLWLALAAGGYYLWSTGKLRLTPGRRFIQGGPNVATPKPANLRVYHTGSIDIPVDTAAAIMSMAIKKLSPF